MIKILISDSDYSHSIGVKDSILSANSDLSSGNIDIRYESLNDSLIYASEQKIKCVVRSTIGVAGEITNALEYYKMGIQVFMPMGSNTHGELTALTSIPCIVTSGAGGVANNTGFGEGIEFFDDDNGTPGDASSFSNGVIAGKLFKIKVERNCDWWEARYCARTTASGNGVWNKNDGYGIIDVDAAINYSGEIIDNPYFSVDKRILFLYI